MHPHKSILLDVALIIVTGLAVVACGGATAAPSAAPAATQPVEATSLATMEMASGDATGCDQSQKNPFEWTDETTIAAGKAIFTDKCEVCHGADGKGVVPGSPNFTGMRDEILDEDGEHFCTILTGSGAMPSWKDKLTTDQMWQALTYIASLSK
jgi:mono/diheme cytochrome c family protein